MSRRHDRFEREMLAHRIPLRMWRFYESGEGLYAYNAKRTCRVPLGHDGPPERFDPVTREWVPEGGAR